MMRQDPDIILVGEIRDHITAEMAFRAAMTGHQVFSTLHTNSAAGAIPRLMDIGILPDLIAGNLTGVVSQRLIRKLCNHCKQPKAASKIEKRLLGLCELEEATIFEATGCAACDQQGYKGRTSVVEILKIDSVLDDLIARRASVREIMQAAAKQGFQPIAEDAVRKVMTGDSSLEEVTRVINLTDRLEMSS
jgi:type IV pilus assembly protein PilB